MAEERQTTYSVEAPQEASRLIEKEISNFTSPESRGWWRQVWALYLRRSRLMWLSFRNYGAVIIVFLVILVEASLLNMKYEFIPYRLLIAHTTIVVEETVQRSVRHFNVHLHFSGVSSLQYQLANLLAHSGFFLFAYLVFYMCVRATNSIYDFAFNEGAFLWVLVLGVVASVAFAQFVSLFFSDPNVSLGVFILVVSYYTFYLFNYFFFFALLFPNILFCFSLS